MAALQLGQKAINFTLRGVDNNLHTLIDYGDQVALAVIFSCNHCPYVQAWEGRLIQIQADYSDQGVQIIAINADDPATYPDDSFENMVRRAHEKGYNFPYLFDETQAVARSYGATHLPEVFLFDHQRLLRYHGAIDDNHQNPQAVKRAYLRRALDAVLGGYLPPFEETELIGCTIKWK